MTRRRGRFGLVVGVALGLVALGPSAPADGAPPPMDPRRMSGIARVDPQVAPGTVTVRVLRGGFTEPAVGVEVTLTVTAQDGTVEERKTTTQAEGRATFEGLESFAGGRAIASVTLDGEEITSQPFVLDSKAGSRLMLVKGATSGGQEASAAGSSAHPEVDIPLPGVAFPLKETPAGRLTVGVFDLEQRRPVDGREVKLTITPPEGEPSVRTATTDERGRAVFDELLPPEVPEGSKLAVEAVLREGQPPKRSQDFELFSDAGTAVYLAEGDLHALDPAAARSSEGPSPLPGPRISTKLPAGTVELLVVDRDDRPVPGQKVVLVKKSPGGGTDTWDTQTGDDGIARLSDIPLQGDSLYFLEARYDEAPYQTPFFGLDKRGGVVAALRVWPVTDDPSRVQSAVRFFVEARENDLAQVAQIYEARVTGDEAFWVPGFELRGMQGAKAFKVLPSAEEWLAHDEKAPFARLAGPLPPGTPVNLSVAYLVEHRGDLALRWTPPFEVIDASVLVPDELGFEAPGAQLVPEGDPRVPESRLYALGPYPRGRAIEAEVTRLPMRNPIYRRLGVGLAVVIVLASGIAIVFRPRLGTAQRLARRREELMDLLVRLEDEGASAERRDRVLAALDRVHRQLRALEQLEPGAGAK